MSGKTPTVATGERRQFNFKELIEKCSENNVYTTAVRAAAQYLHSSETLTQAGVNSVIKIYGLAAMVEDAVEALKIAESKGVLLNVRHYNAVINVCRKHKYYDEAVAVYERLLSMSSNSSNSNRSGPPIYPDIASKSSMIGILGEQGNWQRALSIFREIPKHGRDTILYTTILGCLEKNSRASEAQNIFEELLLGIKEKKNKNENPLSINAGHSDLNITQSASALVVPNLRLYTSIISVHGKNGDWERSWGMFQNMQKPIGEFPALIPDKVLIFTMVRILEKAGQLEKAALVKQSSLKYFVERSVSDDSIAAPNFSDLIREGKRSGDFRAAFAAADSWLAIDR
jgi:pentatricopeptide repeat protein